MNNLRVIDEDLFNKPTSLDDLESMIMQALGRASVCWDVIPTGLFDSTRAVEIGRELAQDIRFLIQEHLNSAKR